MDIGVIMKVCGVSILISVVCQVLSRSGRDDQAMLVSLTGIVVILFMLLEKLGRLVELVYSVFGL